MVAADDAAAGCDPSGKRPGIARASRLAQFVALLRKNALEHRRHWRGHLLLLISPMMFCGLMVIFQFVVNDAIRTSELFKQCGCECIECCYYSPGDDLTKDPPCYKKPLDFDAEAASGIVPEWPRECTVHDKCLMHNNSNCGLKYSKSHQAFYCAVPHPVAWPPVVQMPINRVMKEDSQAVQSEGDNTNKNLNDQHDDDQDQDSVLSVLYQADSSDIAQRIGARLVPHAGTNSFSQQTGATAGALSSVEMRDPSLPDDDDRMMPSGANASTARLESLSNRLGASGPLLGGMNMTGMGDLLSGLDPETASTLTTFLNQQSTMGPPIMEGWSTVGKDLAALLDKDPLLLAKARDASRRPGQLAALLGTQAPPLAVYYAEPAFMQSALQVADAGVKYAKDNNSTGQGNSTEHQEPSATSHQQHHRPAVGVALLAPSCPASATTTTLWPELPSKDAPLHPPSQPPLNDGTATDDGVIRSVSSSHPSTEGSVSPMYDAEDDDPSSAKKATAASSDNNGPLLRAAGIRQAAGDIGQPCVETRPVQVPDDTSIAAVLTCQQLREMNQGAHQLLLTDEIQGPSPVRGASRQQKGDGIYAASPPEHNSGNCQTSGKDDGNGAALTRSSVLAAFDFKDTQLGTASDEPKPQRFSVDIWVNGTNTGSAAMDHESNDRDGPKLSGNAMPTSDTAESVSDFPDFTLMLANRRISGLMNMAANAFIGAALGGAEDDHGAGGGSIDSAAASGASSDGARGSTYEAVLLGIREMPKTATHSIQLDFNVLTGPLFFTWAAQMPLPDALRGLVHEKESRARVMMKMHGLRDATYWASQFLWDLSLQCRYLALFSVAGHASGLTIFTTNSIPLQCTFFVLFAGVQASASFNCSKTAAAAGNLWVILSGAVAGLLMPYLLTTDSLAALITTRVLQLLPPIGLYCALFELSQYSFVAGYAGVQGLTFAKLLQDPVHNAMLSSLVIFAVEIPLFLTLLMLQGGQTWSSALAAFMRRRGPAPATQRNDSGSKSNLGSDVVMTTNPIAAVTPKQTGTSGDSNARQGQREDVLNEEHSAEQVLTSACQSPHSDNTELSDHGLVLHKLRKVYSSGGVFQGIRSKVACSSLSLCIRRGECFGLLGPNGAGKTTAIHMMVGLVEKTSGEGRVAGYDISTQMQGVHGSIGVCLQHDCLWGQLTAEEHLQLYSSLRHTMTKPELQKAVADALRAVDLHGAARKLAGCFSGGMKRRLSLAIALMGSPQVVYLDEPTTGIDPTSRSIVWNAIREAKKSCTMLLTTHSMEEAQALCDRLGIFVHGRLKCIGSSWDLKRRFGNHMVLTVAVATETLRADRTHQDLDVFIRERFPAAELTFALGGTCKFKLPQGSVAVSQVFRAMQELRQKADVLDWGLNGATLEEVFNNVAGEEGDANAAPPTSLPRSSLRDASAATLPSAIMAPSTTTTAEITPTASSSTPETRHQAQRGSGASDAALDTISGPFSRDEAAAVQSPGSPMSLPVSTSSPSGCLTPETPGSPASIVVRTE